MSPADTSNGRVALVTGGGRGIGRGIALALGERGWRVLVNYRADENLPPTVSSKSRTPAARPAPSRPTSGRPRAARPCCASRWSPGAASTCWSTTPAWRRAQRLDILEMSEASYDEVMGVNLKGPLFLTQAVARHMLDADIAGTIINIGSMSAVVSSTSRGEYCISKTGMGMMTKLYADRLADHGILVYELRPGIIETDMTAVVIERYQRLIAAGGLSPIRRMGQPQDVALACIAIVEGAFPFSTGEVINVDGGQHLQRL